MLLIITIKYKKNLLPDNNSNKYSIGLLADNEKNYIY